MIENQETKIEEVEESEVSDKPEAIRFSRGISTREDSFPLDDCYYHWCSHRSNYRLFYRSDDSWTSEYRYFK